MTGPVLPATEPDLHVDSEVAIDDCAECGVYLGLRPPSVDAPAKTWLCGGCGSAYFGVMDPKNLRAMRESRARRIAYRDVLNAADIDADAHRRHLPRRELHGVLKHLETFGYDGSEHRNERRFAAAMRVLAIPLASNFRVIGATAELMTLNISCSGAALIEARRSNAAYLAIDFCYTGYAGVQAILEVLRVQPFVSAYAVAGRWYCRINAASV
jgi:hypothetical protein